MAEIEQCSMDAYLRALLPVRRGSSAPGSRRGRAGSVPSRRGSRAASSPRGHVERREDRADMPEETRVNARPRPRGGRHPDPDGRQSRTPDPTAGPDSSGRTVDLPGRTRRRNDESTPITRTPITGTLGRDGEMMKRHRLCAPPGTTYSHRGPGASGRRDVCGRS